MPSEFTFHFPDGTPAVVHVHIPNVDTARVLDALDQLGASMAVDLTALRDAVTRATTVDESAITLIQQIAAQLAVMAAQPTVNPADLQSLADQLSSESSSLSSAVTANTPAAP